MEYKRILESDDILLQIGCDYIEGNLSKFAKMVINANPSWEFDFGEVFLTEGLKIHEYKETKEHIEVSFGFWYVLNIWNKKMKIQLARITAEVRGKIIAPLQMPLDWENVDWSNIPLQELREQLKHIELVEFENISEEYDDTSIL